MKKILLSLLFWSFLCLINLSTAQAENIREDGNLWITLTSEQKVMYTKGFDTGMQLGYRMSYWGFVYDDLKTQCSKDVAASFSMHINKYFKHVNVRQIIDGLNDFYSDYRNRRIEIMGAIWLVVNGIAGTPKEVMDKMIESWRKNAAD